MEFRILGRLEVLDGGQLLPLGGHRQRALLALLVIEANRVVSVDQLVDRLWGEEPPPRAVGTLQAYLSRLRRILEPDRPGGGPSRTLVTRRPGYLLDVAPDQVDALRFERLADDGQAALAAGDARHAADLLTDALGLWRGAALADVADEPFAQAEIVRLEERRLAAVEGRMEAALVLGEHRAAVGELEYLVAAHPLRERLHGLLMLALYRSERQAEALRAYQNARTLLGDELGLEPGPALKALEQAVVLQAPDLDWRPSPGGPTEAEAAPGDPAPPAASGVNPAGSGPDARHHNLPVALSSFVGRERELGEVARLLQRARLVTLTGVGGAGKTRLALQAAAGVLGSFGDGVFWVELGPLTDPTLVALKVFTALGIDPAQTGATGDAVLDALRRHLSTRRVLLVLDSCERLVVAVAALCDTLLRCCPDLVVLATSRESLGLPGEVAWPVPTLSMPPPGAAGLDNLVAADAVALFVDRARSTDLGFRLDEDNASAVDQICRRLDGIPLALELAAGRLRLLSVHQVAARLDDRFRLLTGGDRSALPRYGTLQASIDWSYDLLSAPEGRLFERLSVFPAGFDLAAVEHTVADGVVLHRGDVLDLLAQLVEKSLVAPDGGRQEARYHLLETLREYARGKLEERGDGDAVRCRHRDFFLGLATEHGLHPVDHPGIWMHRLGADHENFRAALDWSYASGESEAGLRLAAGLSTYFQFGGHFLDGRAWLERALAHRPAGCGPARVAALNGLGFLVLQLGDGGRSELLHEEARALGRTIGDQGGEAMASLFLGARALQQAELDKAEVLFVDGRRGFEATGSAGGVAWCEFHLGWLEAAEHRPERAAAHFERVLELGRRSERDDLVAHAAAALAPLTAFMGDSRRAGELAEEAVLTARRLGLRQVLVMALIRAAETWTLLHEVGRAADLLCESLRLLRDTGGPGWWAESLELAALVEGRAGRCGPSARLLAASRTLREAMGEATATGLLEFELAQCELGLAEALGPEPLSEEFARGRSLPPGQALAHALEELRATRRELRRRERPVTRRTAKAGPHRLGRKVA